MKCQLIVTDVSNPKSRLSLPAPVSSLKRDRRSYEEERVQLPTDTTSAVHRALFGDRKMPSRGMASRNWDGPSSIPPRTSRSDVPQKFTVHMRSSQSRRDRR